MKLLSSKEKYRCSLFSVTEDVAQASDGFQIKRAIVHHAGSAVVLVVDEKKRFLLVRIDSNERPLNRGSTWSSLLAIVSERSTTAFLNNL